MGRSESTIVRLAKPCSTAAAYIIVVRLDKLCPKMISSPTPYLTSLASIGGPRATTLLVRR
jgi:hypothetical protein